MKYAENQAHSGGLCAFLRSGLILEIIRRIFSLTIRGHCPGSPDEEQKHSPNVIENQTRSQNSAYTTKRNIFRVLYT